MRFKFIETMKVLSSNNQPMESKDAFKYYYCIEWNLMMAASSLVVIPVIIVFIIGQRYFMEGLTMSGVKG